MRGSGPLLEVTRNKKGKGGNRRLRLSYKKEHWKGEKWWLILKEKSLREFVYMFEKLNLFLCGNGELQRERGSWSKTEMIQRDGGGEREERTVKEQSKEWMYEGKE